MNYFNLINKCLIELNYKTETVFFQLVKNDHQKLKNILNIMNAEVCGFDNWNFLLRSAQIVLPQNTNEIENSIDGRIQSLIIDDKKYNYDYNFEKFLLDSQKSQTYSIFNDKLLLPKFHEDKIIEVTYYTNKLAKSSTGVEKTAMTDETDISVIPEPFVEPLLVYGSCMRLKANPQYSKFNYWYGMYRDTLANMRSKLCISANETPTIKMERN